MNIKVEIIIIGIMKYNFKIISLLLLLLLFIKNN